MNNEETLQIDLDKIANQLPHLSSSSDYWLVRTNSGQFFQDFRSNGYIGIGLNKITLKDIENSKNLIEQLKQTIIKRYPGILKDTENPNEFEDGSTVSDPESSDDGANLTEPQESYTPRQLSSLAGQLLHFANDIRVNDIIICPSQGSERYVVGKVTDKPYFEESPEKGSAENNFDYSEFTKRIPVRWIDTFSRDSADAKLLKLSYMRHTINDVNNYSSLINRAIFDAYIMDGDELHLTFTVEQESHIPSRYLGGFMYNFAEAYYALSKDELISQVNVQSKGPVHLIFKSLSAGMCVSAFVVLSLTGGKYNIKLFGNGPEATTPGIITTLDKHHEKVTDLQIKKDKAQENLVEQKDKETERRNKAMLDQAQQAYELAKKTGIPISKLDIRLPKRLEKEIQKQLDTQNTSKSSDSSNTNTNVSPDQQESNDKE